MSENPLDGRRQGRERYGEAVDVGGQQAVGDGLGRRDGLEQLPHGNGQGAGEPDQDVGARVGFRELYAANVLVVQARELGQLFLRQPPFET